MRGFFRGFNLTSLRKVKKRVKTVQKRAKAGVNL